MPNENCKKVRHDPDWTPNNYDIYITPNNIPSNIKKETPPNLLKRLQKLMPLSKKLHLNFNMDPETISEKNNLMLNTSLKINNTKVKFK